MNTALFAQDASVHNARSIGLAGSDVTCTDLWSGIHNPAGLGLHASYDIGLNYSNRFLMPELGTSSVISAIPVGSGTFSPAYSYFGAKPYNENHIALAYGRLLAKWLSMGIQLAYHRQSVEALDQKSSAITGQVGLLAIPAKCLRIGLHVKNPAGSAYGRLKGEELDSGVQTGISLSEEHNYFLAAQVNWCGFEDFYYSMGAEYFLVKELSIRGGIKFPASTSFSFGLGTNLHNFSLDIGFEQHTILGLSSSFSLAYKINRNAR